MSREENRKNFYKYVSQNILGMIGFSCYVLADSYFISVAKGADGLTALNLVMPLYSIIFSIGEMIGVGSAIRYAISKIKKDADADDYFWNAIIWCIMSSMIFVFAGIFFSADIMRVLGADEHIVAVGNNYTKIFMCFAPMFMCNYVTNAFVRNDGAPGIAMLATLFSSLFNIVFDYILMFPMKLGMEGAALSTVLSPVIGMAICCIHFFSKKSTIRIRVCRPSVKLLVSGCQLGVSAFVGEMSSAVITLAYNFVILGIAGNIGVAAYGVVANIAIVTTAAFNGIAQGSQPLISKCFGKGDREGCLQLKKMGYITAFVLAGIMYCILFTFSKEFVAIFNSEGSEMMAVYADMGVKLYFTGIFFAGLNIVGSGVFSATQEAVKAAVVSVARGFVFILGFVFLLSYLFEMTGVWLAYAAAEGATCVLMFVMLISDRSKMRNK